MVKGQKRQGDVCLTPVKGIPEGLEVIKPQGGRLILAEGEVTGHAHAIKSGKSVTMFRHPEGDEFLKVEEEVVLGHEEHGHLRLEPGYYKISHHEEYSPKKIRRVAD